MCRRSCFALVLLPRSDIFVVCHMPDVEVALEKKSLLQKKAIVFDLVFQKKAIPIYAYFV